MYSIGHLKVLKTIVIVSLSTIIGCQLPSDNKKRAQPNKKDSEYKPLSVKETSTSGNITIAVDETFKPIFETQISTFEATYHDAKIKALYLPGEKAIEAMINSDSIRLVISTRELTSDERYALTEQGTSAKPSLIAYDAVSFITHKDNPIEMVTLPTLKQILSGEITSWKELNGSSTLGKIQITFDHTYSSTVQFIRDSVLIDQELTSDNVFAANTNPEVISYVSENPNALGVMGVSWISDQDDEQTLRFLEGINVLGLLPNQPCSFSDEYDSFQPYQAFMKENCYPLTRNVYAITRESIFGLGKGFIAYLAHDNGQRMFHKSGLLPATGITRLVKFPD